MSLPPDFVAELARNFQGDIRLDLGSRILYSTDASIYQIEPLGVAIPKTQDDLQAATELAARYRIPILPRGAGTSLAGQAIGPALILDCSRWLDRIIEVDPEARRARVEPGVILDDLNRAAALHGLQFGPDPASAERATMAGVVANNGTGAHSIRYGMAADHLWSAEVVLSDGSIATLSEIQVGEGIQAAISPQPRGSRPPATIRSRYDAIVDIARALRGRLHGVRGNYPASWRNSAGYRLNYLAGWSPSAPPEWQGARYPANLQPGVINLAHLLAGSEGTLAVIRTITVGLVPKPAHTILAILQYPNVGEACDAVPGLLGRHPSAIELIPQLLLRAARNVAAAGGHMHWVRGDPEAVLVIEYSGHDAGSLRKQAEALPGEPLILESAHDQASVWAVRRIGLGLLDARPQAARPISFVEDCAIPVENLGAYVRGMHQIMRAHDALGGIYGHASAGCLHIRPILDLRLSAGRSALRSISESTAALALSLGGSMTSEHGDGIARGEWLRQTYGDRITHIMRDLKTAADPDGILNPGKKLDAPPLDTNLRYGPDYPRRAWQPTLGFERHGTLTLAIERCNGQGVCRKSTGVMCPSFQATREEMHSTRGRANLLRALIATRVPRNGPSADGRLEPRMLPPEFASLTFDALDLCLGCKGCTAECPSGVDMPALKSEFLRVYYQSHRRPLRDYLFGYFHLTARLLATVTPAIDAASRYRPAHQMISRMFRISAQRPLPRFEKVKLRARRLPGRPKVLFLRDPFNHYVEGQVEQAALDLLHAGGMDVQILDSMGAGASLISKGFLDSARRHAERLIAELRELDPGGASRVVAIEPSELSALRHEYAALMPALSGRDLERFAGAQSVEECLDGSELPDDMRVATDNQTVHVLLHCHQKADNASSGRSSADQDPSIRFLRRLGFSVQPLESGCCGMAGTFGYEAEHYELSQMIGEMTVFAKIRELGGAPIAATGAACRMQIRQGTAAKVEHPLVMAARALPVRG